MYNYFIRIDKQNLVYCSYLDSKELLFDNAILH